MIMINMKGILKMEKGKKKEYNNLKMVKDKWISKDD